MKIVVIILVTSVLMYHFLQFIKVMIELRRPDLMFPVTEEDVAEIQVYPGKKTEPPTIKNQKTGIMIAGFQLLFTTLFLVAGIVGNLSWWFFFLILIPYVNSSDTMNLFAITKRGILFRNRFVPWKRIRSHDWIPIDVNHRYYGFTRKVNDGYELKVKGSGWPPISIAVTTESVQEQLNDILNEQIEANKN